MLLVIYNSNPQNKKDTPTIRGWSLYSEDDWSALCVAVSNYFFYMAPDDAELSFSGVFYYTYEEWLADYQVSNIDLDWFMTKFQPQASHVPCLDWLLGTNFYVPNFVQISVDDDYVYPEMDVD